MHRATPTAHRVSKCVDSVSAGRLASWNVRIARRANRPARRTAARTSEHVSEWSELRNAARASGDGQSRARSPTPCQNEGGRMNAQLRRRLEMAGRVREFLRAHKTDGVGEGLGLAKLEELLTRAEVLASQQRSGVVGTRSS